MARVSITDLFPKFWHPKVAEACPESWSYELAEDTDLAKRATMVRDSEILFCGSASPSDEMLATATNLRFVQKLGAGYDNINVDLCKSMEIGLARLNGNNAVAVAEHTVLLMLAVYKRLRLLENQVRSGGWGKDVARNGNREIRAKVIGSIGMGQIGREVAKRLRGFEATVIYYDVQQAPPEVEAALGLEFVPLDELLARSDIVTLHLPVFAETRQLLNRERIGLIKEGAILINCARGELVEEPALVEALQSGHLSGAGLDCVAEERPGGGKPYLEFDNVVLSPHVAGVSIENFGSMMQRGFDNAEAYISGQALPPGDVIWLPDKRK